MGFILTGVGVDYIKARPLVAGASTLVGFGTYLFTEDLVLVIIASVVVGTVIDHVVPDRWQRLGPGR